MDLALGLACGLAGALCYGLSDVGATVASRRTSSLIAAAGMQVTMLAAYVLAAIATGTSLPDDPAVLAQVAFFGCLVGLAFLLSYEAFRIGPLAVVGPVLSLIGALTAVLAVLVLGEQLRPLQGVGVVTATGGLILMAVVPDRGRGRSRLVSRGVVFALVSIVVWATITIGITGPIRQVGALPVMVGSRMASTAILWSIVALVWGRAVVRRRAADQSAGNPAGLPVDPTHQPGGGPAFPRDRARHRAHRAHGRAGCRRVCRGRLRARAIGGLARRSDELTWAERDAPLRDLRTRGTSTPDAVGRPCPGLHQPRADQPAVAAAPFAAGMPAPFGSPPPAAAGMPGPLGSLPPAYRPAWA